MRKRPITSILATELQDATHVSNLIDTLCQETLDLSQESMNWRTLYHHNNVTTRSCTKEGTFKYIQRSSLHTDVSYDQLHSLLFINHSLNEQKYMKPLENVTLIQQLSDEANIFQFHFKTPPLSANREFIELVATKETGDRSFIVVSQPVKLHNDTVKEGYVRGMYQAWEMVTEKEDKSIEWICIQNSTAGGNVPQFISDWVAARDFHHDVEAVIDYIKQKGDKKTVEK